MKFSWKDKFLVYLCYSLGFLAFMSIILVYLDANNLSTVLGADALVQHLPTQFYLEGFFNNILNGIKHFNFNIGLGQDVLFTYHYYGLTDIINIIITSISNVFSLDPKTVYTVGLFLRIYLSGFTFLCMCIYFRKHKVGSVLGAIIYVFSNYSLTGGFMHPNFVNCMFWMPLFIVSIDRLIKENKVIMFIIVSFFTIISNFYFGYIMASFALIYAICSIVENIKTNRFLGSLKTLYRGIVSYIIAAFMTGFVVVPLVYSLLNSIRNEDFGYKMKSFVGLGFIKKYILGMFNYPNINDFLAVSLSVVVLITLIMFLVSKKNYKLKLFFIILCFVVVIPRLQSVLTGFSYDNYKWYFVITLYLSYVFADQYDRLLENVWWKKVLAFVVTLIYLIEVTLNNISFSEVFSKGIIDGLTRESFYIPMIFTILAFAILVVMLLPKFKLKKVIMPILIFVSVGMNVVIFTHLSIKSNVFTSNVKLEQMLDNRALETLSNETRNSFVRIDNSNPEYMNFSNVYMYPSDSIYYGLENKNLTKFNLIYKNATASPINKMMGVNGRTILDDILSVKYYVQGEKKLVPFGFEKTPIEDVYVNKNYIPFGFTYSNYILPYEVASLKTLDMQEALLRACLIDSDITGVKHLDSSVLSDIRFRKTDVNYTASDKGRIKGPKGFDLKMDVDITYDGELYMKLPDEDSIKGVEELIISLDGKTYSTIKLTKPYSKWYTGEKDIVINLGYVKKGHHIVNLDLPSESEFDVGDITFECRSLDMLQQSVKELSNEHLYDITIGNSGFKGYISNKGTKLLFISIPYDEGWSAYVDSEKTKIYRANEGFMAIKLEEGDHLVQFKYKRPFQFMGNVVSIIGLFLFIVFASRMKSINKKNRINKLYEEYDEKYEHKNSGEVDKKEELEDNSIDKKEELEHNSIDIGEGSLDDSKEK